jgi:hypothetical protein
MTLSRRSSAGFRVVIVALLACILAVPTVFAGSSRKILIFPFQVASTGPDKDLQNFNDHVHKRLRSTIESLSYSSVLESEKNTQELLKG